MDTAVFREAAAELKDDNAVIGPARDGGYYLIGFSRASFVPEVFDDIKWSSSMVFSETMRILGERKINASLLPVLCDVDEVKDLEELKGEKNDGQAKRMAE